MQLNACLTIQRAVDGWGTTQKQLRKFHSPKPNNSGVGGWVLADFLIQTKTNKMHFAQPAWTPVRTTWGVKVTPHRVATE